MASVAASRTPDDDAQPPSCTAASIAAAAAANVAQAQAEMCCLRHSDGICLPHDGWLQDTEPNPSPLDNMRRWAVPILKRKSRAIKATTLHDLVVRRQEVQDAADTVRGRAASTATARQRGRSERLKRETPPKPQSRSDLPPTHGAATDGFGLAMAVVPCSRGLGMVRPSCRKPDCPPASVRDDRLREGRQVLRRSSSSRPRTAPTARS